MNDALARFQQRQQLLASAPKLRLLPSAAAVARLDAEPIDIESVNEPGYASILELKVGVSDRDAQRMLGELAAKFEAQRFDTMLDGLKISVLQNVAGPFGLGKVLSAYDKTGGAVDTVHNVRQGVFGTDAEKARYEQRGQYDSTPSHSHPGYIAANRAMQADFEQGQLTDAYTGQKFKTSMVKDEQLKASLDHVVSALEVHDDPARVLAGLDAAKLSNKAENLAPTAKTINSAKNSRKAKDFTAALKADASLRRAQIAELEQQGGGLSIPEQKKLKKLRAQDKVQADLVAAKDAEARAAIDAEINRSYYTSAKFAGNLAKAGAAEGAKAGVQQALGEVLVEFFAAIFDEVADLYRNGKHEDTILKEVARRFKAVKTRVLGKWKKVLSAFKDGFIAGLLSSLVTTLINAFVTTGQRLVRMLRQGAMSLLSAIKMLLFPPKGMSRRQAVHESSKLVVTAGIVVGGIALEEVVSKQLSLVPGVNLIADAATAAIVGSTTALLTSFACYLLDRADVFNVNRDAREKAVGDMLDRSTGAKLDDISAAHERLLAFKL